MQPNCGCCSLPNIKMVDFSLVHHDETHDAVGVMEVGRDNQGAYITSHGIGPPPPVKNLTPLKGFLVTKVHKVWGDNGRKVQIIGICHYVRWLIFVHWDGGHLPKPPIEWTYFFKKK